jgi:hypothetical protein
MVKEILSLFQLAGYDDDADLSLDMYLDGEVLVFEINGGDETAKAVLGGILKVVMTEHGVDIEMVDV